MLNNLGWVPGSGRLGNAQDLPKIEYPVKVYSKNLSFLLNVYILVNFSFVVIGFSEFMKELEAFYYSFFLIYIIYIIILSHFNISPNIIF